MTTYTLHLAGDARPGDPEALDDAKLVKDGFAWWAFFFNILWFLVHRLWLAALGVFIALTVLNLVLTVLHVHPAASFAAHLLFSILLGLEANSLRRWTYARNNMPAVDVVTAADRDEAEAKAFARWLSRPASPVVRPIATGSVAPNVSRPGPVIGMFPDAERPL